MKKKEIFIIALGGSIIVGNKIHTDYLKHLRQFIKNNIAEGARFVLVIGGGAIARNYQHAAAHISNVKDHEKDWIGIHATRLNAHLLRTIFYDTAYPVILDNPEKPISSKDRARYALFIAAGWRPGWSTDYIAMRLARRFGQNEVLIATKIPYVYNKDVGIHKDAKPLKTISWEHYLRLVGTNWYPGMKSPVDPVAALYAKKYGMSAVVLRGTNFDNFSKYLKGASADGTYIA